MAVYTHISEKELKSFLADYQIAELAGFEGITKGVENTNYLLRTVEGPYILTLFEKRVKETDLPFFFAFKQHLVDRGFRCPAGIKRRDGKLFGQLCGRPAVLVSFLKGEEIAAEDLMPDHCAQMGRMLARLHLAAADFEESRPNTMGLSAWAAIAEETAEKADGIEEGLADLIETEIATQSANRKDDLPRGVIHADLFPDNVFFKDGELHGILDFYFACTDSFVYDLALTANAWGFLKGDKRQPHFDALLAAYSAERPLNADERAAFPLMLRAAALRILVTRTQAWLAHSADDQVVPKDPREYSKILRTHQNV